MNPVYMYRFIRSLLVAGGIILGGIALFYLSKYTYPFIIAMIIAFLMNPLVTFFEKKGRLPRGLAVFVSLLLIFLLFAGLITLLVTEIISGTNYLAGVIPQHIETIVDYIETYIASTVIPLYNQIAAMFNNLDIEQQDTVLKNIQNIGESITTGVSGFIQAFLKNIPTIIGWFPTTATALLFTLLGTFFISKDWDTFGRMTGKVLPDKIFAGAKRLFRDLKRALFGFIRAQFTLVSLTTVTILIGFLILGVNYSITIALICGLVDIIPYLGTGTIFIPWIIFEFIAGNTKSRNRFVRPLHNRCCPASVNRAKSSFFQYWFGSACHSHRLVHRLQIDWFPRSDRRTCRSCHIQYTSACQCLQGHMGFHHRTGYKENHISNPAIFIPYSILPSPYKNPPRVRGGFLVSS
ncbi:sporulation integral membrane protein YtvI [Peribacillus sp. B2I2]